MSLSALDSFMKIVNGCSGLPYGVKVSATVGNQEDSITTEQSHVLFSISNSATIISQILTAEELEFVEQFLDLNEFVADLIADFQMGLHNAMFQKRRVALHRGK